MTPVVTHPFNWKRVSVAAALCYAPDGRRSRLYFQARPGAYNEDSLIGFVRALHRALRGAKVTLLWDGLPSHRSRKMAAFIRSQRHWLIVERLPAYAPDLNPVEFLWGNVKGRELANRCDATVAETVDATRAGMARVRRSRALPFAFLKAAGLSL